MKFAFSMWVMLTCLVCMAEGQAWPVLSFDQGKVLVTGLGIKNHASASLTENQWREILPVYTQEAFIRKINQPVAGTYTWRGDSIWFKPDFSFAAEETYNAVFASQAFLKYTGAKNDFLADSKLEFSFSIPKEKFALTLIESVYPESGVLPENMLRMYIFFSAPMMPGEAYDHIKLFKENGEMVERTFLIVDQELWDAERKRFTLLFDPGRIKRGIKSNLDLGMPLREGEKYKLVIDSTWRDVNGNSLSSSYKKFFSASQAERTKLSSSQWKVIPPLTGTNQDLVIYFDRPMDYALAAKYIVVHNSSLDTVSGQVHLVNDTTWKFTPAHAWENGNYNITISPLVEDVAGNNLNNAFDLDLSKESRVNSSEAVRISFLTKVLNK